MRFKAVTVGVVLVGSALGSSALTLGRARGAAWIGQPLELQVPVQVESGQNGSTICADAEVFHGDSRQDASRVQVQVEPAGPSDTYTLKISSSTPVDEPVVTVYLRAGCSQKSSRKYVLLADFPSETQNAPARALPVAPPAPAVVIPAAPAESAPTPAAAKLEPPASAAVAAPKAAPKPPKAAKAAPPKDTNREKAKEPAHTKEPVHKKESAPKPAAKTEKPAEPAPAQTKSAAKARLKLDPVETLTERVKNLEATTTQSSLQDDMARDSQKMQQLQNDLRTLLDQAVKNEASLAAMRERLEKAEANRVPVAVVYGLVALVALCLAALAYLWTRRGQPMRWERDAPAARTKAGAEDNA